MPRFFNRIRKQLAKENKFFQYSRYAIGEILLVVIGILIALQINTAVENKRKAEQERIYLENLSDDLAMQVQNLEGYIEFETIIIDHAALLAHHYEAHGGFQEMDTLLPMLNDLIVRWDFTNANATLLEMLNSGQINLIQNRKLKRELIAFNEQLKSFASNTQQNNTNLVDRMISPQVIATGTFAYHGLTDRMTKKLGDFYVTEILKINDPELQNIALRELAQEENRLKTINFILFRHALANMQKSGNESIKVKAEKIKQLVQQELDLR